MEILTWEILERYLQGANPVIFNMGGTRGVRIGFDPVSERIFIRLPSVSGSFQPSPYAEIEVEATQDETGTILQIFTTAKHLYREFHQFATLIVESFENPEQTAFDAFETAIQRWHELTIRKPLLTSAQQLGLFGELIFLRALINHFGSTSIYAWTGRNQLASERHDFRVNNLDIEIKSTQGRRHQHFIHGLAQLEPSADFALYLLSLRFESGGLNSGKNLADVIESIRSDLGTDTVERIEYENRLKATGYRDVDALHYQKKLIFAEEPMLMEVNNAFPRITKDILSNELSPSLASRIDDVYYRIDVEGFGFVQDSEKFIDILGPIRLEVM